MSIIALLTDFGTSDWFTGEIKGVIYGIAPQTPIVDLSHEIAPADIQCAAFVLFASYKTFPKGTIFCAPIDPDTSGSCPAIIIETDNYFFLAPDNGILSWAVENERIHSIVKLTDIRYFRNPLSMTFRGRDIFAPVAAHLSIGVPALAMGPALSSYKHLPFPEPGMTDNTINAKVLYIDHFGNIITNISNDLLHPCPSIHLHSSETSIAIPFVTRYSSVDAGQTIAYIGSAGFLEIGIYGRNAARDLRINIGDLIDITY